ncbi:MAG: TonB-dependent receptor [Bacteroidota bacterium]
MKGSLKAITSSELWAHSKTMNKMYLVAAFVCLSLVAEGQDSLRIVQLEDVVVTGNKIKTPIEKSGKTIFKLNRKQIEANRGKDVTDLLNEIPGVQIDGNFATPGTDIGYRIRGAQSAQTLILIDGIPFNDPSALQQTFDLRLLDLDQVESIEVLKGGLSSLYGTGAAAGVINIILKKESKERISGNVNTEYGSFNTSTSGANISGTSDKISYMVAGAYRSSDGFSAAQDTLGTEGYDDDGIESLNFLGRLGYQFSDQFSVGLMAAYDKVESDFDGGAFADDDSDLELEMLKFALTSTYKWRRGSLKSNFSYHSNERIFNTPDFFDPASRSISEFNGNAFQADILVNQNLTDEIKLIGGINFQRPVWEPEDADSENFTMVDPYVSLMYGNENFDLQVGGRLNNHSLYGTNFVWNINPSYLVDVEAGKLKLLASYATAFRTPSLNELYSGDFGFLATPAGNVDLEPQESETVEVGFELLSERNFQFGGVYFYRSDNNLIDFISTFEGGVFDGSYQNFEGQTEVDGVEVNFNYFVAPELTLAGHYTYTRTLTDEVLLLRVPEKKFGLSASLRPSENILVKLTHLHVGAMFEDEDIILPSFDLFDGFVSYTLNQFTFSGGVNNIFDIEYIDRFGWNAAERNYNIRFRYSF